MGVGKEIIKHTRIQICKHCRYSNATRLKKHIGTIASRWIPIGIIGIIVLAVILQDYQISLRESGLLS